jgi:hypothetical protein
VRAYKEATKQSFEFLLAYRRRTILNSNSVIVLMEPCWLDLEGEKEDRSWGANKEMAQTVLSKVPAPTTSTQKRSKIAQRKAVAEV